MTFFNKQRSKLMEGKNIKKYLKYALGEIILVVIGILIAVGINNRNERKKLNSANIELKKNVIVQLEKDIQLIENYEQELDTINHGFLKILKRDYDRNKVRKLSVIGTILFRVNTMDMNTNVINMIDNADLNDNEATKELLNLSSNYKEYAEEVKDIENLIFNTVTDNLKEIERSQDWYADFITDLNCSNDCLDFLFNNKQHKARMASLRFLYVNGYASIISGLKNDLIRYKEDLSQIED